MNLRVSDLIVQHAEEEEVGGATVELQLHALLLQRDVAAT